MHPPEFVRKMVASGRTSELADMVNEAARNHYKLKSSGHEKAYNFVNMFMTAVIGQLRVLEPGQTIDDDQVLRVWRADLGLWGVDREEIQRCVERDV